MTERSTLVEQGWIPKCLASESVESIAYDLDTNATVLGTAGELANVEGIRKATPAEYNLASHLFPGRALARKAKWFPLHDLQRNLEQNPRSLKVVECDGRVYFLCTIDDVTYVWSKLGFTTPIPG